MLGFTLEVDLAITDIQNSNYFWNSWYWSWGKVHVPESPQGIWISARGAPLRRSLEV